MRDHYVLQAGIAFLNGNMIDRFNIRVYGLLLHKGNVLVADELIKGTPITKFPGGGLEFGEGTKDCIVREIEEELGVEAINVEHFYTTDFFQLSAFKQSDQIISIYFTFEVADPARIVIGENEVHRPHGNGETFRWLDLAIAKPGDVTLPIDQHVLGLLIEGV